MELAVTHATDDDVPARGSVNNMLIHKGDYKKYSEADYEFHLAIIEGMLQQRVLQRDELD